MVCSMLKFQLKSGKSMPLIGFGTYLITGDQLIYQVLDEALAAGYRHIDTATVYHNESSIGLALKTLLPKYKLTREDIFITSKLSPSDQGERAFSAVQESLRKLDCGYLDLYLIHWPGAGRVPVDSAENTKLRSQSWASLAKAVKAGLVRDIGVSNYTVKHLNELLANDHGVKPSVNQVEWHPKYNQPELLKLCRQEGILLQAYSSLGGTGNSNLLGNPVVNQIATQLEVTPAQVLLRWAIQQNIGIIPKARSGKHIKNNIELNFDIPENLMAQLNNLNSNEKFAWNPETMDDPHFSDKIAQISIDLFNSLPKTGKPNAKEWTVLSCIIKEERLSMEAVALGTGSKCIGKNKMSPKGDILNDSHAEVICRRAFMLYLYEQMDNNLKGEKSIFTFDREVSKFLLDCNIKFHFFTTLMPCGDASIFPKSDFNNTGDIVVNEAGRSRDKRRTTDLSESVHKKIKVDIGDIHRTGAKCLESDKRQDPKGEGADYHITGVVRTKPGRGDPTLSVSCSDKITKWCHLGLQGAFLSIFLEKPIYLSTFTVVGNTPYNTQPLHRAFFDRMANCHLNLPYQQKKLLFFQAERRVFKSQKSEDREVCPNSIIWFKSEEIRKPEVAVDGKKQGVTKKNRNSDSSRLRICKNEISKRFKALYKSVNFNIDHLNYLECKEKTVGYQLNWSLMKYNLGFWPEKNRALSEFV